MFLIVSKYLLICKRKFGIAVLGDVRIVKDLWCMGASGGFAEERTSRRGAAALEFDAGTAGAGLVARVSGNYEGRGLGSFCVRRCCGIGFVLRGLRSGGGLRLGLGGGLGSGGCDLEFVEVGFGAVHTALGLDAGTVDGDLNGTGIVIDEGIRGLPIDAAGFVEIALNTTGSDAEPLFRGGAAAKTPGVADELGGGDFLDGAGRGEVFPEGGAEVVVGFFSRGDGRSCRGRRGRIWWNWRRIFLCLRGIWVRWRLLRWRGSR